MPATGCGDITRSPKFLDASNRDDVAEHPPKAPLVVPCANDAIHPSSQASPSSKHSMPGPASPPASSVVLCGVSTSAADSMSSPLIEYTGYFERHRAAHCGLHAVNNALGFQFINEELLKVSCTEYIAHSSREGLPEVSEDHMSADGDYSEALLAFALQFHGNVYSLDVNRPFLPTEESALKVFSPDVVGVLVNQNNAHWVAVRVHEGDIWMLDSMRTAPRKLSLQDFRALILTYARVYPIVSLSSA